MPRKNSKAATKRVASELREIRRSPRRIPIIGTVGDDGIKIFAEERKERERAQQEARTVAAFLEGGPPDFLLEAMLTAIGDAFDHVGIPIPGEVGAPDDYDEQNLQPLFRKTEMTHWSDLWTDNDRVLDAVHELLHNSQTPVDLWNAVAESVCRIENEGQDNFHHSMPVLKEILKSVPPEDLMAASKGKDVTGEVNNAN